MKKLSKAQYRALHIAAHAPHCFITDVRARPHTLFSLQGSGHLYHVGYARRYLKEQVPTMRVFQLTNKGWDALDWESTIYPPEKP